jgi:glycerol-1-phosphate dehydrogenase [NAD(P)+]
MLADAGRIGRAEPAALGSLAEAILLSGISMAMAGVSSPASGGEHLISHYWDMTRYAAEKNTYALHGTQVGVACCLVEPLHHRVQELRGAPLDVERIMSRWPTTVEAFRERVRGRHPLLPTDVVERVVSEAERKWRHPEEQRERMIRLNRTLEPLLNHVGEALLPEGAIRQALEASGAPTRPSQIAASLSDPLVDWMHVRDMRGRYTVLDFAAELGLFGEPV